jgi:hypothetical protein
MDELESQIAKIQLGNFRASNSYVHITAEKASGSNAELYVVAELPLFNPAALDSCEKICLAIASTLKRAYKRPVTANIFEDAISQINEELGKLASLGQTHWIDKLNCIIGVKHGKYLTISSCGKMACFLLRNKEFTDISCSSPASNPLKTFESFATGKIRLDDLLILSTTQLFNYLSMDRVKNILTGGNFLTATQTIIEILKENAGPEVAFGTLFNLQVPLGQTVDEEIDLETYIVERPAGVPNFLTKFWGYAKALLSAENVKRTPKVNLPKISFAQKLKNLGGNTKNFVVKGRGMWGALGRGMAAGKGKFNIANFRQLSWEKKLFLVSAAVLLLAVILSIGVAIRLKGTRANQQQVALRLKQVQTSLNNAQSSFLYNDTTAVVSYLTAAKSQLPASDAGLNQENKTLYSQVNGQLSELQQKIEKNTDVKVTNLGGLGSADNLIKLSDYVAVKVSLSGSASGNQIVSFNKNTGKIEDGVLKSSKNIFSSAPLTGNTAVIFDGNDLAVWEATSGKLGSGFNQSVPQKQDLAGLVNYATNSRVYTVNKKTQQIINYAVIGDTLSKPIVAVKDSALANAQDLAIDGSIYVLTNSDINKYQSGKLVNFKMPFLVTPYSGSGKIFTDKDTSNIYVLDAGNNRILILDKRGNLKNTLKAKEFTKLKDFQVNEKTKTIYILNDNSLLKVTF